MKLRDYIIVGYILSFLITIAAVFWASNQMLIEKKDTYFIVAITVIAGLIGATISLALLKGVFKSLDVLKKKTVNILTQLLYLKSYFGLDYELEKFWRLHLMTLIWKKNL